MIKDPHTGKRVSRPNPENQWQIVEVPELVIVPKDLYEAVRQKKAVRRQAHPSQQKRQRHLLSGLLRCSCCGASMSTKGTDKSHRMRIRCSAAAESGTCLDPKTFYLETVENAVLTGLKSEMQHPVMLAEYVKTYREERLRLARRAVQDRSRIERRIDEVTHEIERVVDAIAKGLGDVELLGPRSKALNQERKQLESQLANTQEPPNVVALHPQALKRYEMIERLQAALARGVNAGDRTRAPSSGSWSRR
jgi:site-specific DNA recombinase